MQNQRPSHYFIVPSDDVTAPESTPNAPMPPQLCCAIEITHYVSQTRAIKFEPSFFSRQVERLGTDKLSRQPRLRSRKRAVSCKPRIQYQILHAGRERGGSLL